METFKLVVIIIAIAFIALLLILIGLMGENITRLRNINVELKGEIKQLQEKNNELEKKVKEFPSMIENYKGI